MPSTRGIRLSARECAQLLRLGLPVLLTFGGKVLMVYLLRLDLSVGCYSEACVNMRITLSKNRRPNITKISPLRIHLCDFVAECGVGEGPQAQRSGILLYHNNISIYIYNIYISYYIFSIQIFFVESDFLLPEGWLPMGA